MRVSNNGSDLCRMLLRCGASSCRSCAGRLPVSLAESAREPVPIATMAFDASGVRPPLRWVGQVTLLATLSFSRNSTNYGAAKAGGTSVSRLFTAAGPATPRSTIQ
jgi:hypothetical protein